MNRAEAMPVDGSRSTTEAPGGSNPPGASGEAGRALNPQVTAGLPVPLTPGPDGRDPQARSRELDRPGRRGRATTRRLVGL